MVKLLKFLKVDRLGNPFAFSRKFSNSGRLSRKQHKESTLPLTMLCGISVDAEEVRKVESG